MGRSSQEIILIVAATDDNGIGVDGKIPWNIKKDMKYFQEMTIKFHRGGKPNACIMGRKTWESIPIKFRPLVERVNIVLSRKKKTIKGATPCKSLKEALQISQDMGCSVSYVIGGSEIYKLAAPLAKYLFITKVFPDNVINCDTFFDICLDNFTMKNKNPKRYREGSFEYEFQIWERNGS